ncbi:excinuclease ABC subunit C [compost metagenome]
MLRHFGSLKKIKEAGIEDFRPLGIGEKLARTILTGLNGAPQEEEPADESSGGALHSPDEDNG